MNSATDINLIDKEPTKSEVKKRSSIDASLVLGIFLIAVLLALFILEFSRILSLTGTVNHPSSPPGSTKL